MNNHLPTTNNHLTPATTTIHPAWFHTSCESKFSHRGHGPIWGGHGPPMQVFFGENVCGNERNGSHRGVCTEIVCM